MLADCLTCIHADKCDQEDRWYGCINYLKQDEEPRCPHCGGRIERRKNEWYCYSCHFWWEVDE